MADCDPSSKARTQYGDVPVELSFEEIIKNQTASPCSLNDFMDYLFYVERSAENLQFFLWYWGYIQRWSNLLPRQKALSPPWDPEQAAEPRSRFIKYSHKRARSLKMSKVLAIMEMDSERALSESSSPDPSRLPSPLSSPTSLSRASTTILSPTDAPKEDWQPFTIQPFRDEIRRVTRHYLHPSAPRQLRLSPRDRASCLRAGQHTTHPSALHPAFLTAEAHLRAHSHGAFLRWAARNANPPRVACLRVLGALLLGMGMGLDVVLILSGWSVYLRAACVALWWPGLTVLVAAWRGVCLGLHFQGRRQVRPWEGGGGGGGGYDNGDGDGGGKEEGKEGWREHKRMDTASSTESVGSVGSGSGRSSVASRVDPLRKPSLQVFGPGNDYSDEAWIGAYEGKGVMCKVFDETVVVQNKGMVLWQDRTVLFALLWGGAGAAALTVVSLFVPSGRLFL